MYNSWFLTIFKSFTAVFRQRGHGRLCRCYAHIISRCNKLTLMVGYWIIGICMQHVYIVLMGTCLIRFNRFLKFSVCKKMYEENVGFYVTDIEP